MKKTNKTLLVLVLILAPTLAVAAVSDELKRFNKCYALFVGERVKTTDSLWKEVESKKKTGTDACMEIFDKATLNAGKISQKNGVSDEIGTKVLNNFLRFQQSQLVVPNYKVILGNGFDRYNVDVIDSNEAAYHFIYSLFTPKQKYSESVTRDFSLRAIRTVSSANRTRSILNANLPDFQQGTYKTIIGADGERMTVPDDLTKFNPTFVDTGLLTGIIKDTIKNTLTNISGIKSYGFVDHNINQHIGGGAIGTQSYLLGNLGKTGFSNGGTGLFRRWGKNVMDDFLCRDLPALRTTDVVNEVFINSKIAFRTGISCMGCHSSMDPLSAVLSNEAVARTNNGNIADKFAYFSERPPTLAHAEMPTLANDSNFSKRPASGRLFYRSYDGKLIKEEMVGAQELGSIIAETNDFYVCAAKRYYKFLTGIEVDLSDIGNINTPAFGKGTNYQRNKVIKMGLELKNHQSGRSLIKNIIEQNAFIYPDQGV